MKDDKGKRPDIFEVESKIQESKYLRMFRNGLFVAVIFSAVGGTVSNFTDNSVMSYSCPAAGVLDAPVELEQLDHLSDGLQYTNLVKGFVRRMVRWTHPRSAKEARIFYPLVVRHSSGDVQKDYRARLDDMNSVEAAISSKKYAALYPLNEEEIKIRKINGEPKWIVQFEANRVKRVGNRAFGRSRVDATFTVVRKDTDVDGSYSGFYLEEIKYITQTDSVAKNKEEIK